MAGQSQPSEASAPRWAHFQGETDQQRDEHVAALEAELAHRQVHGPDELRKQVEAEIKRIRGDQKTNRLRGGDAEER